MEGDWSEGRQTCQGTSSITSYFDKDMRHVNHRLRPASSTPKSTSRVWSRSSAAKGRPFAQASQTNPLTDLFANSKGR
jgi:hypothetical protein